MQGIKNHRLGHKVIKIGDYCCSKYWAAQASIVDRIEILYTEDVQELVYKPNKHSLELLFNSKATYDTDIHKLKYVYIKADINGNELIHSIPAWKTELDNSTHLCFFSARYLGWFLYRLNRSEQELIYCGVRRINCRAVLYICLNGDIAFATPEFNLFKIKKGNFYE